MESFRIQIVESTIKKLGTVFCLLQFQLLDKLFNYFVDKSIQIESKLLHDIIK